MQDFREPFLLNLVLALFLLHCSVVGFALNGRLKLWGNPEDAKNNPYLQWFFAMCCGLMLNITLLFCLGMAGFLNPGAIAVGGVALVAWSVPALLSASGRGGTAGPIRWKSLFWGRDRSFALFDLLPLLALFVVLALRALRAPGLFDDTNYHLPLARFYVENHAILLHEYVRYPLFPQNMQLLFALGLMLGGDFIAQGMATIPLFVISVGLIGAGVWLLGSTIPGILAVAVLFLLFPVRDTLGYAFIDNGLALFCWGATLAIALWVNADDRPKGWLVVAGILAGGAAGCKLHGGVLAALLGAYLLLWRQDWRATRIFAIAAFAFGSWWYLRSTIISGDPIHPAGGGIFGYFLWNADDLLNQKQELSGWGATKGLLQAWPALVKAQVVPLGLAFFSIVYCIKGNQSLRFLCGLFCAYFVFWIYSAQVNRYLAPVFAVGSFLAAYFLYRAVLAKVLAAMTARAKWLANPRIPAALCLAFVFPAAAYLFIRAPYGMAQQEAWLQKRPGYALFQRANQLIPRFGPRMVQLGFENGIYYFNGTAIGEWFGPGRYFGMMKCAPTCRIIPAEEMTVLMKGFNSSMLAVNTKFVTIDLAEYKKHFETAQQTQDGLLLTLR